MRRISLSYYEKLPIHGSNGNTGDGAENVGARVKRERVAFADASVSMGCISGRWNCNFSHFADLAVSLTRRWDIGL